MEEVAEDMEAERNEVVESVAKAISALGATVPWRFIGQEANDFLEDLSYALKGFGDILFALHLAPPENALEPKALVVLSELAYTLSAELMAARDYHVQQALRV